MPASRAGDRPAGLGDVLVSVVLTELVDFLLPRHSAPPRQQVLITGYVRLDAAARFLMLDTVEAGDQPTPTK